MSTRIIAIDTSDRSGSVAALEATDDPPAVLHFEWLDADRRTAVTLVPAMHAALQRCGWRPRDVNLISVTTGPGSFTGLRIAVTAAKSFAYAVDAKLVGVSTLATLAAQVEPGDRPCWAVLSAQRGELFCARFDCAAEIAARSAPADADAVILTAGDWLNRLTPGDFVAGPPLNRLQKSIPTGVDVADPSTWQPSAKTVGRLGWQLFTAGATVDPIQLTPHYVRRSAAEEKADKTSRAKSKR